jgi:transketolase
VIYDPSEDFPIGGSKLVRSSEKDAVTVVATGITVHEAIKAADELQESGVAVRVIDAYSIKPIDAETLRTAAQATEGNVVAVEDHWPEGGLGEAVLSALSGEAYPLHFKHLAVGNMPGSGKSEELMDAAGISANHVADAVRKLASS